MKTVWTYQGVPFDAEQARDDGMELAESAALRDQPNLAETYAALADDFLTREIKVGDVFEPGQMHRYMRDCGLEPRSAAAWGGISRGYISSRVKDGLIAHAGPAPSGIRNHHAGLVRTYKRVA